MKKQLFLIASLLVAGVSNAQYFSDDFEGGSLTANNAWTTQVVVDTDATGLDWDYGTVGGNYARVTNYINPSNHELNTWLITPAINLSGSTQPTLSFDMTKRYAGDDIIVQISTDYDGMSAPGTATWTDITSMFTLDANTASWAFVPSGNGDITTYISASTYIAFEYTGTSTDGSTWEIDNVIVSEGGVAVPDVLISEIQDGTYGPGSTVNTGGIVTGVFNAGSNVGYFIQAGVGPFTGIYVDDATNVPSRGDSITLTGSVSEAFGNTQLGGISNYTVVSNGNAEPAASMITTAEVNLEDYEGVKVTVSAATCLDPNLGFGEWSVNDGSDTCVVDDLMYAYSPAAGNDYDVTGPVYFSYGAAKIEPRDANDIVGQAVQHTIYLIQSNADAGGASLYNGTNVTVKGVVVAESSGAFNANDRGYWIQDGSGPWHGVYVWDTVNVVNRGDSVEVSAQVNENFNQTILRNVSNLTILSSGNPEPAAAMISSDSVNTEEYEGVLVTVDNATCINPSIGFGQWSINNLNTDALVDDVMFAYQTPVQGQLYRVTGVVYYTYNEYKVLPRDANDVTTLSGIEELENGTLEVYPNPSNGTVHVENNGIAINVFNTTGQLVQTTTESTFTLEEGVYIIKVGNATARVIVL